MTGCCLFGCSGCLSGGFGCGLCTGRFAVTGSGLAGLFHRSPRRLCSQVLLSSDGCAHRAAGCRLRRTLTSGLSRSRLLTSRLTTTGLTTRRLIALWLRFRRLPTAFWLTGFRALAARLVRAASGILWLSTFGLTGPWLLAIWLLALAGFGLPGLSASRLSTSLGWTWISGLRTLRVPGFGLTGLWCTRFSTPRFRHSPFRAARFRHTGLRITGFATAFGCFGGQFLLSAGQFRQLVQCFGRRAAWLVGTVAGFLPVRVPAWLVSFGLRLAGFPRQLPLQLLQGLRRLPLRGGVLPGQSFELRIRIRLCARLAGIRVRGRGWLRGVCRFSRWPGRRVTAFRWCGLRRIAVLLRSSCRLLIAAGQLFQLLPRFNGVLQCLRSRLVLFSGLIATIQLTGRFGDLLQLRSFAGQLFGQRWLILATRCRSLRITSRTG